jgi:tetratricopeptide (TPR) repeat protein
MTSIKIFCSYSHADEELQKKLDEHLGFLRRENVVTWHDRKLLPGEKFDAVIDDEINSSDIILLLVSASFLNSDYCYNIEMKRAIERHDSGEAVVVPVLLTECVWNRAPFAKIVMANEDGKPIDNAKYWTLNEALYKTANNIGRLVDSIQEQKAKTVYVEGSLMTQDNGNESELDSFALTEESSVLQAYEVFKQEFEKLSYKSSVEDFGSVEELKRKLLNEIAIPFDEKLNNIPSLRNKMPQIIFERIYALEQLDFATIQDIQKFRDGKSLFNWYERKAIINSITLSLLISKKFDPKKANLLIDFLTDFEEGVWESALVGLVLALLHHPNKWDRFSDLKKRLGTLRELEEVQEGLHIIDCILRMKLYENSTFKPEIFNQPFFESPLNCFIPFYAGNPVLNSALDNSPNDIDPGDFAEYVTDLPFLDCYKYYLCLGLEAGTVKSVNMPLKKWNSITNNLEISSIFHPYQNLMCEYYNYFKFYPKVNIDNIFNAQMSIAKTKLKNVILDKINELEVTGDSFTDEENYRAAINCFNDIIQIDSKHFRANWKAANCYLNLKSPEPHNGLKYFRVLEAENEKDVRVLCRIAKCNEMLNLKDEALKYLQKAIVIDPNDSTAILQIADFYAENRRFSDAVEVLEKGIEAHPGNCQMILDLGRAFLNNKEVNQAMKWAEIGLEVCSDDMKSVAYGVMKDCYFDGFDFNNSLKYAQLIFDLDPKNTDSMMSLGRIYLLGGIDLDMGRKYLQRSISKNKTGITYGNLGHLELIESHTEKAMSYYKLCIDMIGDEKEFGEKMDVDTPFMVKLGVAKTEYIRIKEDVITYYKSKHV